MEVLGKTFSAPSYAALTCIKSAGGDREGSPWIEPARYPRNSFPSASQYTVFFRKYDSFAM
jgi:hypothetical protein